ncbi:MAG: subclass B3 metallo-beta-lactamase [Terracidiphilus sp.]|nr:subclass B3 metallo-beta-lactamase [Terracidiphilus sp.]MDR3798632.1 subclass B3 metallo-beta-lactamase [Terracidiphilus sp.]
MNSNSPAPCPIPARLFSRRSGKPTPSSWLRPVILFALLAASISSAAQTPFETPGWTRPFPPFRIAGNLYYVGSEDLASYLIVTPQGDILINSNLESSVPLIKQSIETLGFHLSDVKILLISHAHYDHCAGSARILELTGAKYYVMDADVSVVESGGKTDFQYGDQADMHFPATHVDRILHDGDTVALGGTVLTSHLTAGHTRGTTTWTLDETEDERTMHIVIVGSPNVNAGYKLVDNKTYPGIAEDYNRGFAVLNSLPCDIFLGAHGGYFDLTAKYARWKAGDRNAFIDPAGYKTYIADRENAFQTELHRQQAGTH